ncbi:hypothetical protein O1F49_002211 [Enterococcus hirae]|nr:hypothetical protein [Enterococcus hirae]EMF0535609.1 hypothetical protein [Enterococcus hirae]
MEDKTNKSNINKALPSLKDKMWKVEDHTLCEECSEELFFEMKDNYPEFSLSLSVVLNCLFIAEKEGYVPRLPDDWWIQIRQKIPEETILNERKEEEL